MAVRWQSNARSVRSTQVHTYERSSSSPSLPPRSPLDTQSRLRMGKREPEQPEASKAIESESERGHVTLSTCRHLPILPSKKAAEN